MAPKPHSANKTSKQTKVSEFVAEMPGKMADNTCESHQLQEMLEKLKEDINKNTNNKFDELYKQIKTEIHDVKEDLKVQDERINEMEQRMDRMECHNRKYNLLIYGLVVPTNGDVEHALQNFFRDKLNIEKEILICNSHRLPRPTVTQNKTKGDNSRSLPEPIIVRFVKWSDRELILGSAKNLVKEDKISIRTDLCRSLKVKRGKLAHNAFQLRKQASSSNPETYIRTRIRESIQIPDVWLEVQRKNGGSWEKVQS